MLEEEKKIRRKKRYDLIYQKKGKDKEELYDDNLVRRI